MSSLGHQLLIFAFALFKANAVPYSEFIPIDEEDIVPSHTEDHISIGVMLSTRFPYFDNEYNVVFINKNGFIYFGHNFKQNDTISYLSLINGAIPLIAPFWVSVQTVSGESEAKIGYREISRNSLTELGSLTEIVRNVNPDYSITWAFAVTWKHLNLIGSSTEGNHLRNTFQLVIAQDEDKKESFAIFNYAELNWPDGTASGDDKNNGKSLPFAGFFAGDNTKQLPGSTTQDVVNLVNKSNVGVDGQFVYLISNPATINSLTSEDITTTTATATNTTTTTTTTTPTTINPPTSEDITTTTATATTVATTTTPATANPPISDHSTTNQNHISHPNSATPKVTTKITNTPMMTSTSGKTHARHTTATKTTTISSNMASNETTTMPKDLTKATTGKTIPTTNNTKNTETPQPLQKNRHLNTQDALTISIILFVGSFVLLMVAFVLLVFWRRNKYTVH